MLYSLAHLTNQAFSGFPSEVSHFLHVSNIYLLYNWLYMCFLNVLSNEEAKAQIQTHTVHSKDHQQHLKTYHWSRENEVMKRIPGGSWAIYTTAGTRFQVTQLCTCDSVICSSGSVTKIPPKPSDFTNVEYLLLGWSPCRVWCFFFFSFYLQSQRGKFFTLPLFTADVQIWEGGK